jgi:hypothetical protein
MIVQRLESKDEKQQLRQAEATGPQQARQLKTSVKQKCRTVHTTTADQ